MLIGWDSADWKIIHPLVKAGKMPALARMLAEGVCGNVTTLEPQLSPMLWTSIATGKHAPQHGVPGFTEVNHAGQVVPVSAATRRCKALWDMAGEHGLRSHVVSWFATQGEQPAGCLVSNLYNSWRHTRDQEAQDWPPPPSGTYWPEKLGADLNERRVSPWDVDPDEIIRLFVPDAPQVDQANDQRLKGLAQRLSEAFTVHSATCWLLENRTDWNLFAVYYRALDEICHQFMHYHPPQMAGIKDADFAMYRHVVEGAYRLHDLFLARLMDLAGPGTAFVLVSDHGFHSDHLRPEFTPRVPAGITVWHRPQGILCAMGPGFKKGADHYGARLLDVTPTILTWLGMPVGADMEGRVLTGLFENPPQVEVIPSWENTGHPRRMGAPLTAEDQKALLEQFVELGYISPVSSDNSQAAMETARENDWNMARASMDCGRYEEALALLENVATLRPDRQDYLQMLAICRLRLGMLPEASAALETALQSIAAQTPATLLIMANIALEDKNAAAALTHLDAAARMEGFRPGVQHWEITIRTLLALHAWTAAATRANNCSPLIPAMRRRTSASAAVRSTTVSRSRPRSTPWKPFPCSLAIPAATSCSARPCARRRTGPPRRGRLRLPFNWSRPISRRTGSSPPRSKSRASPKPPPVPSLPPACAVRESGGSTPPHSSACGSKAPPALPNTPPCANPARPRPKPPSLPGKPTSSRPALSSSSSPACPAAAPAS